MARPPQPVTRRPSKNETGGISATRSLPLDQIGTFYRGLIPLRSGCASFGEGILSRMGFSCDMVLSCRLYRRTGFSEADISFLKRSHMGNTSFQVEWSVI
jgi:hypothetical protein